MAKPPVTGSLRSVVLWCVSVLLLASASPARRRLLEQAGVPHRVRVSGVDEAQIHHADPAELVKLLAQAKAEAVAQALDPAGDAEVTAVLGCDSVLSFEGQVFGKPAGPGEAIERWQRMAGRCGSLLTGHCLMRRGQADVLACVETVVRFAPLNQAEIEAYVTSGEPLQCAGGFALEGRGGLCIDGLEGCYSNVIGLSLPWLRTVLGQQLA
ncbi:septum formation inhibitor Maf [Synechococcus sp. MU1625]|nr:nucleoside triphosphate pyrophosphatase [Synechococcus sp. MU1625]MCB4399395.1 septum formation inhibitor Maf [Synechococcus sp. MU1625]